MSASLAIISSGSVFGKMTGDNFIRYFTAVVFFICVGIRGACTSIALQELCLVVLGPYPDETAAPIFQPSWNPGPALIPAVRLATDKINNRTDILNGYKLKLLEGDSGCDVKIKTAVSFVGNVFRSTRSVRYVGCPVVGIIGPACSGAATVIGSLLARDDISLLHIAPSAISPVLTNSSTYPNTFRVVSSSLEYVSVYIELIKHNGWDTVAALYDADTQYTLSTFEHFRDVMESESISNIGYSSPVSNNEILLSDIYAKYKVVFAFVGNSLVRKILCLAYHFQPSLIYPAHQWIFHDSTEKNIVQNISFSIGDIFYSCSEQQMIVASEGIILNVYRLKRDNVDAETDVDLTLDSFSESYERYLSEHLREINLTKNQYSKVAKDYAPVYYDATWAMALSLSRSASDLVRLENITLSDYSYGIPHATAVIKRHLSELKFEGISGRVTFRNTTHDSATNIEIYQLKYTRSVNSSSVLIGYYNDSGLNLSPGAEFVSDSFEKVLEVVHPAVSVVFFILIVLTIVCVATLHFYNVYYQNHSSVKAGSPRLSHLIFSGCYLLMLVALLLVIVYSKWMADSFNPLSRQFRIIFGVFCNVNTWCSNTGYSLILGTLCVQLWRLYRIFNHIQPKFYYLSDKYLVFFVVCFVAINLTVMLVWISNDPQLPNFLLQNVAYYNDGLQHPIIPLRVTCRSRNTLLYGSIPIGINMIASLCLVVLSILNRHIQKRHFNPASGVNVYVYVTAAISVFGTPIGYLLRDRNVHYFFLLWQVSFLSSVVIVCVFLFFPRVQPIIAETLCSLSCK